MNTYSFIKTLAAQMLMPLPLCLGLLVVGLLLRNRWRRLGNGCALLALLLLVLFSWAPVADRLLAPFESAYPPLHSWPQGETVDAVMVLGGGYQPHQPWVVTGQLSDSSANRLLEGLRLWHLNPDARLIVSGSSGDEDVVPMAQAYANIAQDMQVPASQLHVLDTPTDTGQEARAAAQLLGEGSSLLLVTSASHMPRSMQHFRQAGLTPIAAPTHYLALRESVSSLGYWVPAASHLRKSERAIYEALGLLAVRWE
ncbi:envelope biogenesis factor ElyC [Halomonas sediminis]